MLKDAPNTEAEKNTPNIDYNHLLFLYQQMPPQMRTETLNNLTRQQEQDFFHHITTTSKPGF